MINDAALPTDEKWTATCLNDKKQFDTFKEAVHFIWHRLQADLKTGLAWQLLEMIWIEPRGGGAPIMFYPMRDIGAELGWFEEWKKR